MEKQGRFILVGRKLQQGRREAEQTRLNLLCRENDNFFLTKRMDTPGKEATSEINQTAFATSEDLRWGILRSSLAFLSNPNDCFDMR